MKLKKKNNFITFLCACLMTCATAFGLINSFGTTLASSPTLQTQSEFEYTVNNITSININDYYDGYFIVNSGANFIIYSNGVTPIPQHSYLELTNPGVNFDLYFYSGDVYNSNQPSIQKNTFYTMSSFASIGYSEYFSRPDYGTANIGYDTKGNTSGTLYINSLRYVLPWYSSISLNVNGVYYTYCSQFMYNLANNISSTTSDIYNNAYNDGYIDGEQSSDAYQNGFNAGKDDVLNNPNNYDLYTNQQYQQNYNNGVNNVVNNPNNYDLYTDQQYQQNYDDGYINGIKFANQGFLLGSTINVGILYTETGDSSIQSSTSPSYIINSNNIYVLSSSFYTDLSNIQNDTNKSLYNVAVNISGLSFYFSEETVLNVINPIGISTSTSFHVRFATWQVGDNSYTWFDVDYNIVPVINDNQIVNYEITYNIPNELYNRRVLEIAYAFSNASVDIPISQINNFALYDKNVNFNNGYELGYIAGTSSDVVQNAYDEGYETGNRVGYQTGLSAGLNNENRYTFLSLLTGVVQAPVNVMKDLFDFEILGFNMLNFFLGCLTAVLILWLVRKVTGG